MRINFLTGQSIVAVNFRLKYVDPLQNMLELKDTK